MSSIHPPPPFSIILKSPGPFIRYVHIRHLITNKRVVNIFTYKVINRYGVDTLWFFFLITKI